MAADVVIFDPATIRDVATFDKPNQLSEGMRFVLVNGVPVIDETKMTNALPGKVVSLIGVHNLVVVETDDALLVTTRDRAQEVGKIVAALRKAGREDVI